MGPAPTPFTGTDVVEGATAVLDHLHHQHPDVVWALTRRVPGGLEVLDVRDGQGQVRTGDLLDGGTPAGDLLHRPLLGQGDEELGALWCLDRTSSGALAACADLVDVLARLLTLVLRAEHAHVASARRSEVLHEQAHTDELTGLPNRRGWAQVLEAEQSGGLDRSAPPSVLVIDLDRLKEINDVHGHVAGDEYLQLAAATLAAASRDTDFVARLGGDEFGVLVTGSGPDAAALVVERIRRAFDAAGVAASIGFAAHEPEGGLERTWWRADRAMYAEKLQRRRVLDLRHDPADDGRPRSAVVSVSVDGVA